MIQKVPLKSYKGNANLLEFYRKLLQKYSKHAYFFQFQINFRTIFLPGLRKKSKFTHLNTHTHIHIHTHTHTNPTAYV